MRISAFLAFCFVFFGCTKGSGSINDIYRFSDTKDVRVQVNLTYKIDVQGGPNIEVSGQRFVLNAFLYQDGEVPIEVGYAGEEPLIDLPVVLNNSVLTFDATLRLPATAKLGADGYALHFSLKEADTAFKILETDSSTVKNLEAMKGGVQPGADPADNPVSLSLSTTLAYRIAADAKLNTGSALNVDAYEKLLAVVVVEMKKIESSIDPSAAPNLSTYASAILAGTKLAVMQSASVQSAIVGILQPAVEATSGTAASAAVASSMTTVLKAYSVDVKAALGSASAEEFKIFKTNSYDPALIPDPVTYVPAVYAPLALTFNDSDLTTAIGGNITLTPPASQEGIDSYNIYFGAASIATAKQVIIGNVKKSASALQLNLPTGTVIPPGATHFWAFPVANNTDFASAISVLIVNNTYPPAAPQNLAATGGYGTVALNWNTVADATSYNLYWSDTSPATIMSQKIAGVSPGYIHRGRASGSQYFYVVTAVKDGKESALSNEASARTTVPLSFTGGLSQGKTQCFTQYNDVVIAASGDIYVAGTSNCDFPSDAALSYTLGFLSRFSPNGTQQWVKTFYGATSNGNSSEALVVTASASGAIYVGGSTNGNVVDHSSSPTGYSDIWYAKFDEAGVQQWIQQKGAASATLNITALATDDAGVLYASGSSSGTISGGPTKIGNRDGVLFKINPSSGSTTWIQLLGTMNGGGSDETEAVSLAVTRDGSQIYVMGQVNGDISGGSQQYDSIFLARFQASGGAPLWVKQSLDGNGPKKSFGAVRLSPDESKIYMSGTTTIDLTNGSLGNLGLYSIVYDTTGVRRDLMQLNVPPETKAIDMLPLADGSFVVTGYTDNALTGSMIGSKDWYLMKFDASHAQEWVVQRGVGGQASQSMGLAVDAAGHFLAAGFSSGNMLTGSGAAPGSKAGYLLGFKADGSAL